MAQSSKSFGITASAVFAKIEDDFITANEQRIGQESGVFLQFDDNEVLSFRFGIGYSFVRAKGSVTTTVFIWDDTTIRKYQHHDIVLPLALQVYFKKRPNRMYCTGALVPAINIGRSVIETQTSTSSSQSLILDITEKKNYKPLDLFTGFGLGYEFQIKGSARLYMQLSYRFSVPSAARELSSLISSHGPQVQPRPSAIRLEVGYLLR